MDKATICKPTYLQWNDGRRWKLELYPTPEVAEQRKASVIARGFKAHTFKRTRANIRKHLKGA